MDSRSPPLPNTRIHTHARTHTHTHTYTHTLTGEDNLKSNFNLDIWGSTPADLCTAPAFYGCFRTAGAGGNWLNPVKSASFRTVESFSFKYGKVTYMYVHVCADVCKHTHTPHTHTHILPTHTHPPHTQVEVRAKLPRGDWLWPAIWMLPRWEAYGKWPSSGEIDIMESRGNPPSYAPGRDFPSYPQQDLYHVLHSIMK